MTRRNFKKNEDAVSPVIGVILMVAITVILAAVIGAFVFGMGPKERAPVVNFVASSDGTNTTLTVMGGDNVSCSDLSFKVNGNVVVPTGATNYTGAGNTILLNVTGGVTVVHNPTNSVIFQS